MSFGPAQGNSGTSSASFDVVFGGTQGSLVYRNASSWVALAPGTSGQLLRSGGAAANPSWATISTSQTLAQVLATGADANKVAITGLRSFTFATGLGGAINVVGPSDGNLTLNGGTGASSGQSVNLNGGNAGSTFGGSVNLNGAASFAGLYGAVISAFGGEANAANQGGQALLQGGDVSSSGVANATPGNVLIDTGGSTGNQLGTITFNCAPAGGSGTTGHASATAMTLTSTALTLTDAVNVVLGTSTGTKIGTATTQKLGFFNATPVVQQTGSSDVLASLVNLGLRAASSNPPLNLGSGALTAGASTLGATTVTTLGTGGNVTLADGNNVAVGTTTGTQIGTGTTQKLAIFGATPAANTLAMDSATLLKWSTDTGWARSGPNMLAATSGAVPSASAGSINGAVSARGLTIGPNLGTSNVGTTSYIRVHDGGNNVRIQINTTDNTSASNGQIAMASNTPVGWSSSGADSAIDTALSRDSAGVVDFGTGAAQSVAGSWKATNGTLTGSLLVNGSTSTLVQAKTTSVSAGQIGFLCTNSTNANTWAAYTTNNTAGTNNVPYQVVCADPTTAGTGVGGGYALMGFNNGTSAAGVFAMVRGIKENNTAADTKGALSFYTAEAASNPAMTEQWRITSGGVLQGMASSVAMNPAAAAGTDTAGTSFTIGAGTSTGAGLGGNLIFQAAPKVSGGSSGTGVNAATTLLTLSAIQNNLSGTNNLATLSATFADGGTTSSGTQRALFINPTINYTAASKTGSYAAIQVDAVETSNPTGVNYFLLCRAGASGNTNKFYVDNTGGLNATNGVTSGNDFIVNAGGRYCWSTRCNIHSPADGQVRIENAAATGQQALVLGPTVPTLPSSAPTHGQVLTVGCSEELLTLSTSGTTTDTTANLLPANSIILSVTTYVTTTITTATNWSVGDSTTAARFSSANSTLTSGTNQVGINQANGGVAAGAGMMQTSAAKVRITTTGTPGAGAVRITVHYIVLTPPTS